MSANFVSVELTDIIASLVALAAIVVLLRFWQPKGIQDARDGLFKGSTVETDETPLGTGGGSSGSTMTATEVTTVKLSVGRTVMAFFPYIVVVPMFSLSKLWAPFKNFLAGTDIKIAWPGSNGNILTVAGKVSSSTVYTFPWLSGAGSLLMICGVIVMAGWGGSVLP